MASHYEIADFYRQLALLTKSELPLPETLRNLADASSSKDFKAALEKLGEETGKGRSLSESMKEMPGHFPPFFSRLVAVGERNGTLPKVLAELAAIARVNYQLSSLAKDILFYPLITVTFSIAVLISILSCVVPPFKKIFDELLEGAALPAITNLVLWLSDFACSYLGPICLIYLAAFGFVVWIFVGGGAANTLVLRVTRLLPLSEMIFYNFAMARACSLWGVMMRQKVPDAEALRVVSETTEIPALAKAFGKAADACAKGVHIAKAIEEEHEISRLLHLALSNASEETLPEELGKLAELFRERGYHGFRRTAIAWEILSIIGMAFVVGGIIIILFTPFVFSILNG